MNSDLKTNSEGNEENCIVCEKPVRYGTGFAHIKYEEDWVTLCCPLCMETFQKNPRHYVIFRKAKKFHLSQSKSAPI